MVTIRLHNTKTRTKEAFTPLNPDNVRMYVCGPTVYDRAHIGNARPVVVFDVLFRLLRHVYGADHVTYVRNFTDVDDRINATAQERRAAGATGTLEALIHARSDETIQWYHDDMAALGALPPTFEPRATEYIGPMITMIQGLIGSGHAYEAEGHVLFAVESYAEYGQLSGRSIDDMIAGARVEVAPYKRNPMDFVLWKPSPDDLPGWHSPWGRGRPGWHIECSAMSYELLGAEFDIHAGGLDLQFPHHENEIAQSRCAHPEAGFAKVWMHNEMLMVDGRKMSKSLGNFFTVRDLLDQGYPGEVIRMVYLGTHYSKPMDWTAEKASTNGSKLDDFIRIIETYADLAAARNLGPTKETVRALSDDLNTHSAMVELDLLAKHDMGTELAASIEFLGILTFEQIELRLAELRLTPKIESIVVTLIEERKLAKLSRDYTRADHIRRALSQGGIRVVDSLTGTEWSVERDEIDPLPFFDLMRSGILSDDSRTLSEALKASAEAGVHFTQTSKVDELLAWRSKPKDSYIMTKLEEICTGLGLNK